nr:PREDICTED: homeobox protein 13-like isoform X2 [Linepithema humile]
MKCVKIPNNKNSRLTIKRDENVTITTSDKIMKKNDDSPQSFQEYPVSGYDTPVIKKQCANNTEDSPMLNYYPSPTLLPFTQEGGNEVAWDWQSSVSKTPEDRSKKQNACCDTPKGTKLLQRKRNSNSPLLYKPFKRKIIKMKNIENIGQFAAELQALNEKVRFIKQNDKSHSDDHVQEEEEASILVNTSNEQEVSRVTNNEQNCIGETNNDGNILRNNVSGNYDDLFDDSVDESMIKCTQEMEEKFNLIAEKENFTQANVEKKESPCVNEATVKTSVELVFNENFKESPTKIILHKGTNHSNTIKTYSRLPMKKDANSSIHTAAQRDKSRQIADKSHLNNNNNMINSLIKSCDNKKLSKHYSTEVFDFPDDSFDDCLATCVEDEKLLFNDFTTRKSDSTKFETSYKRLTHASLKSEVKPTNFLKSTVKVEPPSSIFENRKFFKTKSLSDQYFAQNAHTSVRRKRRW